MKDLLIKTIEFLKSENVQFGEARIGFYQWQNLFARDMIPMNIIDTKSDGVGIRVLVNGAWGFASTSDLGWKKVETTARKAIEIAEASALVLQDRVNFTVEEPHDVVWCTKYQIDPFEVDITEKIEFLIEITKRLKECTGISQAIAHMNLAKEHKYYMNTLQTYSDQCLLRVHAGFNAMASGKEGFESRSYAMAPLNAGYERILQEPFFDQIPRVAEEAVMKLHAPLCPAETADLILLPSHTALTIHETIGHATELDRVMGWEADMAGTSFATIDKLNKYRYASELINVTGDRTFEHGRASVPVDDEGVKTSRFYLIKNGILSGYSTTRSTAAFIGENHSRGCCYADSWASLPILRMPNVSIEPGPDGSPSLDQLIEETHNGVLVDGTGSFSIDHQRINFQFGGDCAWRIRDGKKHQILRRFTYQSCNPIFWNSVDAICGQNEWQPHGVVNCGKGQPVQVAQLTHGSSPLRVRNIAIGKAKI